ncbi:MAG: sensor histidine kinase [Leptothrix sp. (in: Bacteria)]|nr:sensor histidine kinase [Leptothrix sp. (in: b-proteobacteria)]
MRSTADPRPRGLALMLGWRRVLVAVGLATLIGLLFSTFWKSSVTGLFGRVIGVGLLAMLAFGLIEQWPRRLPRWLPRWPLQVFTVAITAPVSVAAIYWASTPAGAPPFWQSEDRFFGFGMMTIAGLLLAPWVALGALVRQREAFAREQSLAFDLERSELERQAIDARMRLLQAQVQPHFLFNTLANVRALVNIGSPRASVVLDSLIDYLRAAVPRLDEPACTLADEVQLVRAYLELMQMRLPDRLRFALDIDEAALPLRCPPLTLMTLVENAVRHGIDPAEEGGCIEVRVRLREGRCCIGVCDSGVGLHDTGRGAGVGLANLRQRLQLAFGPHVQLRIGAREPRGVCAEVEFAVPAT